MGLVILVLVLLLLLLLLSVALIGTFASAPILKNGSSMERSKDYCWKITKIENSNKNLKRKKYILFTFMNDIDLKRVCYPFLITEDGIRLIVLVYSEVFFR